MRALKMLAFAFAAFAFAAFAFLVAGFELGARSVKPSLANSIELSGIILGSKIKRPLWEM